MKGEPVVMTTQAQQRCCTSHSTLEELTRHLIAEFRQLEAVTVAREVARATAAADFTGLGAANERLLMVELIARQQLELVTGRRADAARLDPERHGSRATTIPVAQP
jgi:hypothetical protein